MTRPRVPAAIYRYLDELTTPRGAVKYGGVMEVPRMLPYDEWEALAAKHQDALIAYATEDRRKNAAPPPAPYVVDPQSEHERLYQLHRAHTIEAAQPYLKSQVEKVAKATARKTVIR